MLKGPLKGEWLLFFMSCMVQEFYIVLYTVGHR